jgi:glycosyltransferase involved in cell wall biosynthesis
VVLSELFEVTLAIVGDHGREAEVLERVSADVSGACASILVMSRTAIITRLVRRTQRFRMSSLWEAVWPIPLLFAPYPRAIIKLAERLAHEHFEVVHCFRLNAGILVLLRRHHIRFGRSVLDFDSYESQAEFRSIATFRSLIGNTRSIVSWLRAVKLWMLELLLIPRFDDGIVCSEFDRQRLEQRFRRTRWHVVPNIVVGPPEFSAVGNDCFTFLFVGQLGYLPNWDAAVFFCTQVLPILRRDALGEFRVLIVGRAGYNIDNLSTNKEVQVVVNAPDVAPYYARSEVVIVPLRGGGGTRVKILEAFSYGLPVVSTTIGAEGLDVTPGSDIVIADGAEAFARECLRIWKDEGLRRRIAAAGRDLWRRKYSPPALAAALTAIYEQSDLLNVARQLDTAF